MTCVSPKVQLYADRDLSQVAEGKLGPSDSEDENTEPIGVPLSQRTTLGELDPKSATKNLENARLEAVTARSNRAVATTDEERLSV